MADRPDDPILAAVRNVLDNGAVLETMMEERLLRGAKIVRALAASEPIEYGDTYHWCSLCNANLPMRVEDHAEDCVWRQAREWADEL